MTKRNAKDIIAYARQVIRTEAEAAGSVAEQIDSAFVEAVEAILALGPAGRVVLSGVGKPAFIANKISATFASTGTPSYFLHPADAIHGDVGRVTRQDVVILLSNSGESKEILDLLNILRKMQIRRLIAITGNPASTLAKYSDLSLNIGAIAEACPMGLAPSATTTAMLALGDALALTVLTHKQFGPEDYALFHPGGALGRKLMKVRDIMRNGAQTPLVNTQDTIQDVIMAVTKTRAGAACVVDAKGKLLGIFTDGDLRRSLNSGSNILQHSISEVMTKSPRSIHADALCSEAGKLMREKKIDELPVVDDDGKVLGLLDIQDLLGTGLI